MTGGRPLLEVAGLSAAWDGREVLHQVSFDVRDGELLTLLGPNGSGKTTLLRTIAGFERPTSGEVRLDGRSLASVPPHQRSIGLLFQEPALFAHRTVYENIAYAPLLARRSDSEVDAEVTGLARLLELAPLLARRPDQLSGGERQRVALARSLAARPRVVLLDEPFASVDPEIRGVLRGEFRRALRDRGTAAIHVTHDRDEGIFLGDRVALLFDGALEAVGDPGEVVARPTRPRVARFLGYNVVDGPDGPVAVLPSDLEAEPAPAGPHAYFVVSSGRAATGYRTVLGRADGARVEVVSPERLPEHDLFRLRWRRSVPLAADRGGPTEPQSPRSPPG